MIELSALQALHNIDRIHDLFDQGELFIYPTDTVYGIGCDATNQEAVAKLREAKKRPKKPFSVIAPSPEWIERNLDVPEYVEPYLERLPGPVTLILRKKDGANVAPNVSGPKLGVRIPSHGLTELWQRFNKPFITTSANISGEPTIQGIDEVPEKLREFVALAIDDGKIGGSPSNVYDCTKNPPQQLR
jgi:L-threonylcarbamoyladenylate synthase